MQLALAHNPAGVVVVIHARHIALRVTHVVGAGHGRHIGLRIDRAHGLGRPVTRCVVNCAACVGSENSMSGKGKTSPCRKACQNSIFPKRQTRLSKVRAWRLGPVPVSEGQDQLAAPKRVSKAGAGTSLLVLSPTSGKGSLKSGKPKHYLQFFCWNIPVATKINKLY